MTTDLETVQALIASECDEVKELLLGKNRKYGSSFANPLRVFSRADPLAQLDVRIDDKLSRIANRQDDEDEDPEKDLLGYLVLKRVARRLRDQKKEAAPVRVPHELDAWAERYSKKEPAPVVSLPHPLEDAAAKATQDPLKSVDAALCPCGHLRTSHQYGYGCHVLQCLCEFGSKGPQRQSV